MSKPHQRYRTLSAWLKNLFGEPVRKITIDAGLGCPNRHPLKGLHGCIFCNPRGSGTGALSQGLSVAQQVDKGIAFLEKRYGTRKFIGYFQSYTNTYAPLDRLESLYEEALQRPEVVGLAIGTRPDCVPDETLDLLGRLAREKLVWIEYGLQSIHDRTLDLIRRGHSSHDFFDAVDRTRQRGIGVVAHLIIGLPGETVEDMVDTAKAVSRQRIQGIKIHPLYVIRGTELARMHALGEYAPLTEKDCIHAILEILKVLPSDMVIHRLTSDPHPMELVTPKWMLDRRQTRKNLMDAMERTNLKQGSFVDEICYDADSGGDAKGNGKNNNTDELENPYSNTKITSALTRYS